ncbi:hypothetical protein TNIN_463171 [Trichonephila inaurata madagascariensis]|uniref:Uncharacterized protein n=1 Tax=Trichonephila inaurata madagascariensis TaxID=2747483 RepID=A0A8X6WMI2_9ARAC|nr:hypothetical protein TNIN_463171 [Trichonephila inaurata madagascariensis]
MGWKRNSSRSYSVWAWKLDSKMFIRSAVCSSLIIQRFKNDLPLFIRDKGSAVLLIMKSDSTIPSSLKIPNSPLALRFLRTYIADIRFTVLCLLPSNF